MAGARQVRLNGVDQRSIQQAIDDLLSIISAARPSSVARPRTGVISGEKGKGGDQGPPGNTGNIGEINEDLIPTLDCAFDLASAVKRLKDAFFCGNLNIPDISLTFDSGTLEIKASLERPGEIGLFWNGTGNAAEIELEIVDFKLFNGNYIKHRSNGGQLPIRLAPTVITKSGIGAYANDFDINNKSGYSDGVIAEKTLVGCRISGRNGKLDGELTVNENGGLMFVVNGINEGIMSGVVVVDRSDEDGGMDLEWTSGPKGFNISLFNGDSDVYGNNGVKLIVGMARCIGANSLAPVIDGGLVS